MHFILHCNPKMNAFIYILKIRKLSLREINKLGKATTFTRCDVEPHTQICLLFSSTSLVLDLYFSQAYSAYVKLEHLARPHTALQVGCFDALIY